MTHFQIQMAQMNTHIEEVSPAQLNTSVQLSNILRKQHLLRLTFYTSQNIFFRLRHVKT